MICLDILTTALLQSHDLISCHKRLKGENHIICKIKSSEHTSRPLLISFLLPSWRALRSYWPHLEERDPIWGDDCSHSPFIRRSPSWYFLGVSSAVRQMPGDLCTAPRIIPLSSVSLATDATLGTSGLWLGTRTGIGGTATLTKSFFWPQPMAPCTTGTLSYSGRMSYPSQSSKFGPPQIQL